MQLDAEMADARAAAWHQMADWWLDRCAELETRLIRLMRAVEIGEPQAIQEALRQAQEPLTDQCTLDAALEAHDG